MRQKDGADEMDNIQAVYTIADVTSGSQFSEAIREAKQLSVKYLLFNGVCIPLELSDRSCYEYYLAKLRTKE